jgi:hypothetical protein
VAPVAPVAPVDPFELERILRRPPFAAAERLVGATDVSSNGQSFDVYGEQIPFPRSEIAQVFCPIGRVGCWMLTTVRKMLTTVCWMLTTLRWMLTTVCRILMTMLDVDGLFFSILQPQL